MQTPRLATVLAVGVGAVIGVGLALSGSPGQRRATPSAEPPFRPIVQAPAQRSAPGHPEPPGAPDASVATGPRVAPPASSAQPEPTPTGTAAAPPDPAAIALAPSAELIRRDEKACARGVADRCARAARFYEEGKGVRPDPKRALTYLRLAVKLYAEDCRERNARACYSLSRMYQLGRGVPPDVETSKALVRRARDICEAEQSAFCDAPDAPEALRR